MKYIELTQECDRALSAIIDAALKNVKVGGMTLLPHIDFLKSMIKEREDA